MITSIRIDFRGAARKLLLTASFIDQVAACNLIENVLIDDQYNEKGPYALEIWDTSTGKDVAIHIYMLAAVPPHTERAFTTIAKQPATL